MNEGRTTAIFFVVAVVLGLAWWSKPAPISDQDEIAKSRQGQDVFPDFEDPASAASLQIAQYDEELAQLKRFEVARDPASNLWTLPSNDDYPADAAEQVKDATTPLIGLQILDLQTDLRSDHETYGVVNPDDEALAAGASGVGMLVTLKDEKDVVLASLIIGKEVEGTEGQRYVRIPTEDAVYIVELGLDAFSTNFRDWIEAELLGVRSFDITRIGVRDYDLERQSITTMSLNRNFDAEVQYDSSASEWNLSSYQTYEGGTPQPAELGENETLNTEYLNAMRTAAQDLEIVDVKRKPTGLAADLKADASLLENEQSITSLQSQGFYPAGGTDGTEIFAAGGETIIGTDDGVRYVLRFGEATASLSSLGDTAQGEGGLSRYLLVTAKLDESDFPYPDVEVAPTTVEEMLESENGEAGETAAGEESADGETAEDEAEKSAETPGEAQTPSESVPSASDDSPTSPEAEQGEASDTESEQTGDQADLDDDPPSDASDVEEVTDGETEAAGDETQGTASSAAGQETDEGPETDSGEGAENDNATEADTVSQNAENQTSDETAAEDPVTGDEAQATEAADETAADEELGSTDNAAAAESDTESDGERSPAESQEPAGEEEQPQETEEELKERLEALREDIARENQRKIDERNEKLEEARKKVQELNARFSEWYYVVSDSEYNKLKLTRDDLIKNEQEASNSATPNFSEGLNIPGLQPSIQPQP